MADTIATLDYYKTYRTLANKRAGYNDTVYIILVFFAQNDLVAGSGGASRIGGDGVPGSAAPGADGSAPTAVWRGLHQGPGLGS